MKYIISFVIRKVPRKYLQLVSHFALNIVAVFYKGDQVECPVCLSHFRKFLPYGRIPRANALCPKCLALERHRLMYLYLQKRTNFFTAPLKVLHVAPEHCFIHRFEKMKNLDYVTADIESPLAKIKMDIHAIPFADNTFDVAFCNHVMEHVDDDIKAMSELHRVLKPNGWAIIQSPMDLSRADTYDDPTIVSEKDREKHFRQKDHLRLYGLDYKERLEKGGFTVLEDRFVMELPRHVVDEYGLPDEEIVYYCTKKV